MGTPLLRQYRWLEKVDAPSTILVCIALHGTLETLGPANNPEVMGWAKELDLEKVYTADSIAWCGLFAAVVVSRAGLKPVKDPLWARNWVKFGKAIDKPCLGDVLVFTRKGGGGHVGFYVGEDAKCFHVFGGNQSDKVSITRIEKDRLIEARRPLWASTPAPVVKPYQLSAEGAVSDNEA